MLLPNDTTAKCYWNGSDNFLDLTINSSDQLNIKKRFRNLHIDLAYSITILHVNVNM